MSKVLLFGAIASVLTLNAFAETTTSTVTSRNYVDAQDALKQNKIPEAGTNYDEPGVSVVTYTEDGNGTIGERWICDAELYGDNDCDNNNLVTLDLLQSAAATDNLPETTVAYKTCTEWSGTPHTDANCLLWSLGNKTVYGETQCTNNSDCPGACNICNNGQCIHDEDCLD